jgi:pentose-5-phosphate-3-epimerase/CBS domain-containing protein
MKISASIYSRNGQGLEETVRALDAHRVDYIHVDCPDDLSVFGDIARMRQVSSTPIDLHLITQDPSPFFEPIRQHQVNLVCVQQENLAQPLTVPDDLVNRFGLAVTSDTPLEVFAPLRDRLRFALFMATTPGRSGGRFDRVNFRRIRRFKRLYPELRIHVDGGVDEEVSFILRNMGVYAAVSGSFLLDERLDKGPLGARLMRLMHGGHAAEAGVSGEGGHFQVADFMMERGEIPLLSGPDPGFAALLQCIDDYSMGFALLEDEEQRLIGLVSNADVRRGLLKHLNDLNQVKVADVLNRQPMFARENDSVHTLLGRIKSCPFPVNYLPVLDEHNRITGALQFHNLIKGES